MGNAAHKASAQAAAATALAGQAAQTQANVIAQYGPVTSMAIHTAKKIGVAYPKR